MSSRRASGRLDGKASPAGVQGLQVLVWLNSAAVVICALYFGRAVLIPITLAVLLSFLLAPFVDQLRRMKLGQVPSVLIAVVLALSLLTALGTLIGAQVGQLAGEFPRYEVTIERKVEHAGQAALRRTDAFLRGVSGALKRVAPISEEPARDSTAAAGPASNEPIPVEVHAPSPSHFELARRFLSPVFSPLATAGIMLIVAIFVLLQREDLRDRLIRLFGPRDLHRTTVTMDEAARGLSRYFLTQLAVNAGVGMVVAAGLWLIGVPGALLFVFVVALLRFVPYFGMWIAAGLASIMAMAVGPGWSTVLWTLALFGTVEAVAVQLAEPFLYGSTTGLSPFAVIVAAIFWSWIWGPVGLVLSTPLTLCLVILGRHVERLEFFDVLFGDRPALTPADNFYQRVLANDSNEALAQAESLLRERSLCAYYDTVVIEGLRHARNDLLRGVITAEQLRHIRKSALEVIERLEAFAGPTAHSHPVASDAAHATANEDALPSSAADETEAHARSAFPVLCIGGRGKLDSLAATVATQMLAKSGFGVGHSSFERYLRHDAAELARVKIFCVVSLDAPENPLYLRSLLRKLAQQGDDACLIVGLAPAGGGLRRAFSGREVTVAATLDALVEACVAVAGRVAQHVEA